MHANKYQYIKINFIISIMIKSKLHELLWQRRITQKELAQKTKLAESTISKLAQGDCDCKLSTLDKICNILDCKISDIIEFNKD